MNAIQSRIQKRVREEVTSTTIPIIGKIKTGYLHEKGYPVSTDYFIVESKYESKFKSVFGEKPNSIMIAFYNENVHEMCREFYELRDKQGRLRAVGDGTTFSVWTTRGTGEGEYQTMTTEEFPDLMASLLTQAGCQESKWTHNIEMHFLIPPIKSVYGCWRFRSRGERSTIPHIVKTFDTIRQYAGRIAFVPFDLQVSFAKSQKPGAKSRFPVVSLVPNISQEHVALLANYTGDLSTGLLTEQRIDEMIRDVKQLEDRREINAEETLEVGSGNQSNLFGRE